MQWFLFFKFSIGQSVKTLKKHLNKTPYEKSLSTPPLFDDVFIALVSIQKQPAFN